MASSFRKVCGFAVHTTTAGCVFGFLHPETISEKCVFRIRVDGRPKRCNTCAVSPKSVVVWRGLKHFAANVSRHIQHCIPGNSSGKIVWQLYFFLHLFFFFVIRTARAVSFHLSFYSVCVCLLFSFCVVYWRLANGALPPPTGLECRLCSSRTSPFHCDSRGCM